MRQAPLREGFGSLVAQTARLWRRAVDDRLQPFGLTEATWLPLLYLSRAPASMRQKELAAALSVDSSSIVRILDALQAAGLVERREEATDRRAKAIFLTPLGRSTVSQIDAVSQQVQREALAGITEKELEAATEVLQSVHQWLADSLNHARATLLAGAGEEKRP